jgi:hypothetical protein
MNGLKKFIGATAIALASMSSMAGDINVGGVVWDPNWRENMPNPQDFEARFDFRQWFTGSLGSNVDASTPAVDIQSIINDYLDDGQLSQQYFLNGVGEFYKLNEYGIAAPDFCPGCELTFEFGLEIVDFTPTINPINNQPTVVPIFGNFNDSFINVYVDHDESSHYNNDIGLGEAGTAANIAEALDGDLWIGGAFQDFFLFSGSLEKGSALGDINLTSGLALDNFQDLGIDADPFADMGLSASVIGELFAPSAFGADNSATGNGLVNGETIPEPASLAVFGLGLLGLAGAARRKKA